MTRVLILGSGGRIGRLLRGITGITPVWHNRADFDLMDTAALRTACAQVDIVLNLAGVTHHGPDSVGDQNTVLARQVLDCAGQARVFLMSSAAVYGAQPQVLCEDSPLMPQSRYGEDKVAMEEMAQTHATPSVCLRVGNVLGADALLGQGPRAFTLHSFENGTTPQRSYIGPQLLARVLVDLMHLQALPDVINISTPEPVEMGALLNAAGFTWESIPAPEHAIARVALDTSLLQSLVDLPDDNSRADALVSDWQSVRDAS